ncbi:hypothetical protein [sulfur-oxidizing endosymbiont of Gigantopelta aegis]|uniref:hypothetical protein n=1 Tax=sulfur-oxidizing endosymbiont of Gigantopelta aegis TaxID=2794934 RepID=UPI0018DE5347|nr:hypothetical protein [sulfur-oxidizing endosymbiont of Gigantopelta aegis]
MTEHPMPNPGQLRQIPSQFSWIDHRLVRDGHFELMWSKTSEKRIGKSDSGA